MANSFTDNARIFWVLLRRESQEIFAKLKDSLINFTFIAGFELILCYYFFPHMGLAPQLIAPIFLGTIGFVLIVAGHARSMTMLMNTHTTGFTDYHLSLPVPKRWLLSAYVTSAAIDFTLQSILPSFLFLITFMHKLAPLHNVNWLMLLPFHLLGMASFATFFIAIAFVFSFEWFNTSIWPRVLVPMLLLGAVFYPLREILTRAPRVGYVGLFNPATYLLEGYRIVFLGAAVSDLSLLQCCGTLTLFLAIAIALLYHGLYKRIDPV